MESRTGYFLRLFELSVEKVPGPLVVAKNNELTVLTSDEVLKRRFKVYYSNVISYDELRKIS